MKTIPNSHSRHRRDRFQLTQESDLHPLAVITRAHTQVGIDRYETLAEIILRCAARTEGLFPPGTDDPCHIDTIVASLARQAGHHFAGPANTDTGRDAETISDPQNVSVESAGTVEAAAHPTSTISSTSDDVADAADPADLSEPALFPGLSPSMTFNQWAHEYVSTVDTPILGTLLGTSLTGTQHSMANAMTLVYGLPGFLADAKHGLYTMEHIDAAARLAAAVPLTDLPEIDRFLTHRRADVTVDTLIKALKSKIRVLTDPVERQKQTHAARRVEKTSAPTAPGTSPSSAQPPASKPPTDALKPWQEPSAWATRTRSDSNPARSLMMTGPSMHSCTTSSPDPSPNSP